ncbi:MAG TPA: sigma factor, partial [Tepidisphaeraceae bacterium]|nr:sigma factor [Tepidisphaeraceae bacterium]
MFSERDRIHHQLLVLRCRRGDAAAWRELIAAWEPRLFYYVRRLVPREADAWDVLQQTWLGAYRNLGALADPKLLPAWLYRIARN